MEIQMRFIAILFASLLIDGLGLAQISNDPPADPFAWYDSWIASDLTSLTYP